MTPGDGRAEPDTAAPERPRMRLGPLNRRRVASFRANRRAWWSLWTFLALFVLTLFAELIANDRPLLVSFRGELHFPTVRDYPETRFGGRVRDRRRLPGPLRRRPHRGAGLDALATHPVQLRHRELRPRIPAPSPPSRENWLGTDDQGRDVLARAIYGFRISVLFGLALTLASTVIGVLAGAVQGYFGGWVDLGFQRFIEVWSSLPELYLLMILASVVEPNFGWLLLIMLLFSWMALVGVVRAEFLRARNFEYVRAARALGVANLTIMLRHVLPNAMVASLTFLPFILNGSIVTLTSLDFLGFGMPPGSPSLGELVAQGKANLHAPWLGITAFSVLAVLLSLLIFVFEGVRDAFDPRKTGLP